MRQYERAIRDAFPRQLAERKIEQIKRQEWFVKNKTEPVSKIRQRAFDAEVERKTEELAYEASKIKV